MNINLKLSLLDRLYNDPNTDIELKAALYKRLTEIGFLNNKPITSFKEACDILGLVESEIIKPDYDARAIAFTKLSVIIEALNEGWKPDFTDEDQYKYYNYFRIQNGLFVFCSVSYGCRSVGVPSALLLKTSELAIYAKDNFFDLYKQLYL